jgi:hypothetical protein
VVSEQCEFVQVAQGLQMTWMQDVWL